FLSCQNILFLVVTLIVDKNVFVNFGVVSMISRAVTDPRDGRRVALKKLPNVFQSLVSSKRVFRELKMLCFFKHDNKLGVLSIYAIPRRLEFPMRVGGCITLHTPRPPTFRSVEYAAGNHRGKSEASERVSRRLRVRTKNASHRPG
ncbi:NLK2 kinase, partial [Acromyrmex heyeri]